MDKPKKILVKMHTIDENDEIVGQNILSNMPLLFAGGYPTSLDKISESQLEQFIPFMVQCSLGYIQMHSNEYSEPEWWPEDVPYSIPLIKTDKYNWHAKLKEIVIICYSFHKSIFLLRFCNELAAYQPECLRFINNYNSTTSLFDRVSNKLLVTFRNENMLYDQIPINNKKTLLPRVQNSRSLCNNNERMVEAALFDIYLCDNCEAELYSLEAYKEHEKFCQADDDVIFCGTEEISPIDENLQKQSEFLQIFNLFNPNATQQPKSYNKKNQTETLIGSPEEKLRLPRRSRATMVLAKCPNIAISSPAGQQLLKTSKTVITNEYILERLNRMERFCHAPPLGDEVHNRPKFMRKKYNYSNISQNFRRPPDYNYHFYNFPHRQYWRTSRIKAFLNLNASELKQCRPFTIKLKRLTQKEIDRIHQQQREKMLQEQIKEELSKRNKNVVDFIDLCSSDDEDDSIANVSTISDDNDNDNCDGSLSQMAATPYSEQQIYPNSPSMQPVVLLFSKMSKTPITDSDDHNEVYGQEIEENNCNFLNGAKSTSKGVNYPI